MNNGIFIILSNPTVRALVSHSWWRNSIPAWPIIRTTVPKLQRHVQNSWTHSISYAWIYFSDRVFLKGTINGLNKSAYVVHTSVICGSPKRNEIITTIKTNISWHMRCFLIRLGNPSWMEVTTTSTMANWNEKQTRTTMSKSNNEKHFPVSSSMFTFPDC